MYFRPIKDLYNSFKKGDEGFSARKMCAFYAIVIVAGCLSFKYADKNNVIPLVNTWLIFAGVCLGLVTIPQVIELVNLRRGLQITKTEKHESTTNVSPDQPAAGQ